MEEEKRVLLIFVIRFLWNGMAGYLPVFIAFALIYLINGWEPDRITTIIFAVPAILAGLYLKVGEKIYDLPSLLEK